MNLFQVDAFTNELFRGNPAGVCILPDESQISDTLLQDIAREMNVSETAFLHKINNEYNLRWFTPETEVDFCGHATLSSAHILWETKAEKIKAEIIFNTKSGKLYAKKIKDKIELNFPIMEVIEITQNERVNEALNIKPIFTGTDNKRFLLEIEDIGELQTLNPNYFLLKSIGKVTFIVTCKSNNTNYDFYSRFFAPSVGINEDPVTGSAHSYLAPYWAKKLNKNILNAHQASSRGGDIECEIINNGRVLLRGNAKTVFEIKLNSNL